MTIPFWGDWNTPQQDICASSLPALPFPRVKPHKTSLSDQGRKLLGHPREAQAVAQHMVDAARHLAVVGTADATRLEAARMGYGLLAYRDALLITPELGVALSSSGATTSLGISLAPYSQQGYSYPWEVVVERQHHSKGNSDNPTTSHSLQLRFSLLL